MELADIKNVTVAGGGTQGSQIASQIASKGFHVTVWLRSEGSIDRAPSCSPTPPRGKTGIAVGEGFYKYE